MGYITMAQLLYRTNISLTGNAKLGVWLGQEKSIDHCALAPVSSGSSVVPSRVNIHNSTLGHDLSEYYKLHQDIFYSPQIPSSFLRDEPYKHLIESDYTVDPFFSDNQYGLKRVSYSKTSKQMSLFAPMFIRSAEDIPSAVQFVIQTGVGVPEQDITADDYLSVFGSHATGSVSDLLTKPVFIRKVTVPIKDTVFGEYLRRSYRGVNGVNADGSDVTDMHIMNINPQSTRCVTRGWSMESGGVCEVQSDLMNKLFTDALTYQEFNSYICDEYRNFKMTCPWILNLCWYFNPEDLLALIDFPYGQVLKIDAEYLDGDGNPITRADLDMNHRVVSPGEFTSGEERFDDGANALDFYQDWATEELWNNTSSHLAPITNTWALSGSYNKYIFNVYPGFDNPDISWNAPYFQDQYDPSANTIANTTSWMHESTETSATVNDVSNIIYTGTQSLRRIFYGMAETETAGKTVHLKGLNDYQDFKNTVICNGVKYNIDYSAIIKQMLPTAEASGLTVDKDHLFIPDETLWSISKMYNRTDLTGDPRWMIIFGMSPGETKHCLSVNIILWMPNRSCDLTPVTLCSLKKQTLPAYDTTFIFEQGDARVSWTTVNVDKWSLTEWITYVPPQIMTISSSLTSYETGKKYNTPYYRVYKSTSDEITMKGSAMVSPQVSLSRISTGYTTQRYFGWIQPRTIPLAPLTYDSAGRYVRPFVNTESGDAGWDISCTKATDTYRTVRTLGDAPQMLRWGDGCGCSFISVPDDSSTQFGGRGRIETGADTNLGEQVYDYFIFSRIVPEGITVDGKAFYDDNYKKWGSLEWKCYDWSQVVFLPPEITVTLDLENEPVGYTIGDCLRDQILRICGEGLDGSTAKKEVFMNRIISLYTTKIDSTLDKSKYLITFRLK